VAQDNERMIGEAPAFLQVLEDVSRVATFWLSANGVPAKN